MYVMLSSNDPLSSELKFKLVAKVEENQRQRCLGHMKRCAFDSMALICRSRTVYFENEIEFGVRDAHYINFCLNR